MGEEVLKLGIYGFEGFRRCLRARLEIWVRKMKRDWLQFRGLLGWVLRFGIWEWVVVSGFTVSVCSGLARDGEGRRWARTVKVKD